MVICRMLLSPHDMDVQFSDTLQCLGPWKKAIKIRRIESILRREEIKRKYSEKRNFITLPENREEKKTSEDKKNANIFYRSDLKHINYVFQRNIHNLNCFNSVWVLKCCVILMVFVCYF